MPCGSWSATPTDIPSFMPNLERWETVTDGPAEIGSRYTVHWKIGAAPVGGVIELVEFDPREIWPGSASPASASAGRFRLRDAGSDGTKVTFRLSYQSPGGLLGLLADRLASRQVGQTLSKPAWPTLRTIVES